jgi:hypothetical protein
VVPVNARLHLREVEHIVRDCGANAGRYAQPRRLAYAVAHGPIRGSFVPDHQTQQMRDLLRTRKQLVRERSRHVQRLQKTLEDANIKLDSWSSPMSWACLAAG